MSNDKPEDPISQDIKYEDFKIFADNNPGSENLDYYKAFPSKPTSTIRRWKMNYLKPANIEQPNEQPKDDALLTSVERNNEVLMKGTLFTEKTFSGMDPQQINKFLVNFHQTKPKNTPNSPIVGTPVGSGKKVDPIDKFLKMDPINRRIEFSAPASMVFGKSKNKEEALKTWLH